MTLNNNNNNKVDVERIKKLYRKGLLTDDEFLEYSKLRVDEYHERRDELVATGATNIQIVKDDSGDIVGWKWTTPVEVEPEPL